jgi:hypothetical protein
MNQDHTVNVEVPMTGRFVVICLVLVLATLAVPVAAQNVLDAVTIPYEFTIGSRKLAAGQYSINRPVPADPRVLGFRGNAKHQKAVVTTSSKTSDEPAPETVLVFARYGDAYFLRSVHIRGARELYEVPMSKAEEATAAKGPAVMVTLKADQR